MVESSRNTNTIISSDRLISLSFDSKSHIVRNIKSTSERPNGYPRRAKFYEGMPWRSLKENGYKPAEYTDPKVFKKDKTKDPNDPKLWADPADINKVDHPFLSFEGILKIDKNGRPLNPKGPTGIEGRGLLGLWGANYATDAIVTRINDQGQLEMAIVTRPGSNQPATAGGMLDRGETAIEAAKREFKEETTGDLDFTNAIKVYEGYVDDPRNTDNAWIETTAYHLHLEDNSNTELKGNGKEGAAKWAVVNKELLDNLYASHANTVKLAVSMWQNKTHKVVDKNGFVR